MNNKSFIVAVLRLVFFGMIAVGGINFIVDPGKIYLKKILTDYRVQEYAEKLLKSRNGLVMADWNERAVKTALAKNSEILDCVILGSSHIMQVSMIRNTGDIQKECKSLVNLGVSGGGLEDLSIFSYLVLDNKKLPKKVFIEVAPWTFNFGKDIRWKENQNYYLRMNERMGEKVEHQDVSYLGETTKNLINREYFSYSIRSLRKHGIKSIAAPLIQDIIYPKSSFYYRDGYSESVFLSDGSLVYAKDDILQQRGKNAFIDGKDAVYKIDSIVYNPNAVKYFEKILKIYAENGVEVGFILTPYHPNVFKLGDTQPVRTMKEIEKVTSKLAQNHGLKVYGSFFPEKLGCKGDEFFDFMHANSECLNKIDFSK